jgi:hypothetical protein
MRANPRICATLLAIVLSLRVSVSQAAAPALAPFVVTASNGPAAGSHVLATVTRTVGKTVETLPAALVPALQPGDVVDVDFPDYRRPPGTVNYHVNVAFITEAAPQHWLFPRSGPADRLFVDPHARAKHPARTGAIHFVYGAGDRRGIPIFFIVPEDAKTRGVDGVRDYVDAHPTDFVDMSQSTNAAVDRYSFMQDFLSSLGSGSIDPQSSRNRIESVAQTFGVSPAAIDACYAGGGTPADVNNCIQQAVDGVVYQTNFSAPTEGQFLGGVAGAAAPLSVAPYIASLLTVWRLFVGSGRQEYEYLPTTVSLADPSARRPDELLMGLKIPTLRPPGAYSDVLFFTIGDPQATQSAPTVVDDAPAAGMCERAERFSVPLHFDHTSRYVHDAALDVSPDGGAPYAIPLDPRTLSAPIVDRTRFHGSRDGAYTVALRGRFSFDPVEQPAQPTMRAAFPNAQPWTLAPAFANVPRAGGSLDLIASSPAAACLSHAELQIGSAAPVALDATPLDANRVELRASLAGVPAGPASIRFDEDDPAGGRAYASSVALTVQPPPAQVDPKSALAALGDGVVRLTGSGFERVRSLLVDGVPYAKEPGATATAACFAGPPLSGGTLTVGQQLTAQLAEADGAPGEVFPLTLAAPRPVLAPLAAAVPAAPGVQLSTTPQAYVLQTAGAPLPADFSVRLRQAGQASPCAALTPDPDAVTLPGPAVHRRTADALDVDVAADVLHDRAFGTLQVQLVDAATGFGSDWIALPGTFARAPEVAGIDCPPASVTCRIYGTGLGAIDAVEGSAGTFVAPGLDCPPTDKGVACVIVPRAAHYIVRLVDGGTLETLPDTAIAAALP